MKPKQQGHWMFMAETQGAIRAELRLLKPTMSEYQKRERKIGGRIVIRQRFQDAWTHKARIPTRIMAEFALWKRKRFMDSPWDLDRKTQSAMKKRQQHFAMEQDQDSQMR
jgi:hypothetical protein